MGQPTYDGTGTYVGTGNYAPGAPYGYFKNALKFYGSTYGVRSVLWLQGETDAKALRGGSDWTRQKVQDANDYAQKLTQVINQSRQDLKNELAWMVGKASFIEGVWYDAGTQSAQSAITVRQGQEQVISSGLVKRGPDIDQIKERGTGPGEPTHLAGAGLWKAADAWFGAIQSSNLLTSSPITPQSLGTEPRELRLDANGTITTALPAGSQYIWYSNNSSNGGRIDLNAPAGYGPTMPTNITDPLVIIQDSQGNSTLGTLVLPDLSAPSTGSGNGLLGNYFNNTSLSGSAALSRTESTINFTWDGGGSSPFPGVSASNMSARWEGQVEAPVSGQYTFSTNNDDATNLWVNGQQLINDWPGGHGAIIKSGVINLQAGQKYNIKLEFNQGVGGAQAQLLWSYPGQGQQIIPQGRLYSSGSTTPPPGNCNYTEGQYLFTFNGTEAIYAHYYNGVLFAAYQNGSNFKPQHWLTATGLMSSNNASCFAENDPHSTTNPVDPPTGSLAFQIVSYDCNSGVLQYKFSSNNSAVVNVTMPGIFGGTMSPNTVASTTFPGDAKVGRTVTGTASQSGNQININFTTSCNLTTTQPPGNCNYTEGQYLFATSWGEVMYAHFYNGVLYAGYQDGSNFRPQHWLVATGQMTATVASCFAENDPHSSGGRVAAVLTNEPSSEADFKLIVYPNPNNGHFEISTSVSKGQIYTLQVLDLLGNVIMKQDVVSKGPAITQPIDLPNLNLTSVIVQVKSGLNVARKVVVIHK